MANTNIVKLQGYFNNETVMKNLKAMLGTKAQGFATSVLSVVNNNKLLQNSDPSSIYCGYCTLWTCIAVPDYDSRIDSTCYS